MMAKHRMGILERYRRRLRAWKTRSLLRGKATTLRNRQAVYCGGNRVLTQLVDGHKIFVDSRDVSIAPHLILDGYWEDWISDVARAELRPGMKVVEVGANVGYYTLLISKAIGPSGRLISFEADPEMAKLVHANIAINGYSDRAHCIEAAVCDQSQDQTFYRKRDFKGGSSLVDLQEVAKSQHDAIDIITVPGVTLDEALVAFGPVDFMKIDAEGAELRILQGAAEVLSRSRHIRMIIEFHPERPLYDFLDSQGFRLSPILPATPLAPKSFERLAEIGFCDVLAFR